MVTLLLIVMRYISYGREEELLNFLDVGDNFAQFHRCLGQISGLAPLHSCGWRSVGQCIGNSAVSTSFIHRLIDGRAPFTNI